MRCAHTRFLPPLFPALVLFWGTTANGAETAPLTKAWELCQKDEFKPAQDHFQAVRKSKTTEADDRLQALYGEACCWNYRPDGHNGEKARSLYSQVMAAARPGGPLLSWSDLESVQSLHFEIPYEERDFGALANSYLGVYQRHPETPAGEEAYVTHLILLKAVRKPDWAALIQKSSEFIRLHPTSPWISRVYTVMADCHAYLGQSKQQVESMIRALESKRAGIAGFIIDNSTAYWNIAYLAEFELGDFELARQYYGKLIKEYPRDNRLFIANQALKRMNAVEAAMHKGFEIAPDAKDWSRL